MRVKPTTKTLRATYDLLKSLAPFNTMGLPPSSAIRFKTGRKSAFWGRYWFWRSKPTIWVMEHQTVSGMIATMAHEMLHLQQEIAGTDTRDDAHNKDFRRLARLTCQRLGIEIGGF